MAVHACRERTHARAPAALCTFSVRGLPAAMVPAAGLGILLSLRVVPSITPSPLVDQLLAARSVGQRRVQNSRPSICPIDLRPGRVAPGTGQRVWSMAGQWCGPRDQSVWPMRCILCAHVCWRGIPDCWRRKCQATAAAQQRADGQVLISPTQAQRGRVHLQAFTVALSQHGRQRAQPSNASGPPPSDHPLTQRQSPARRQRRRRCPLP